MLRSRITPVDGKAPLIDSRPLLQKYYDSLESRIGYRLFLGDSRHFGYYASPTSSPWPVGPALRAMEGQLFEALRLPPGSRVLDAGCGTGHVAIYMANRGDYRIEGIEYMERHVIKAQRNVRRAGLQNYITVQHGDYHHLEAFASNSFDGIYTMETLVHSTDPLQVLREFRRILRPGGHLALHEYDHEDLSKTPTGLTDAMANVNKYAAMPGNEMFDKDYLKELVREAGFDDVQLRDLSAHITPMLWLFYIFAVIPLFFFRLLGIEHWFVNTLAGAAMYQGRGLWRYIQVAGKKGASRNREFPVQDLTTEGSMEYKSS